MQRNLQHQKTTVSTTLIAFRDLILGLPRWYQWERTHLPIQETGVLSLGQEDPLEEGMATHSSILAWKIPWTDKLGGLQSMGLKRVGHD